MCSENESDELICPCCAYRANADDYEVYLSLVNESKTSRLFHDPLTFEAFIVVL